MKATGIIRRVDDLGRVVIPKEIRRSVGIREGDLWKFSYMKMVFVSRNTPPINLKKFMMLSGIWPILQKKKVVSV